MIVCHCNRIDHVEIARAAEGIAADNPWTLVTPVAVYRQLGKRPRCGGCLTLAARIIHGLSTTDVPACTDCPLGRPGHLCPHAQAHAAQSTPIAAE